MTINEKIEEFKIKWLSNWYEVYDEDDSLRFYAVKYRPGSSLVGIYLLDPNNYGNSYTWVDMRFVTSPGTISFNNCNFYIKYNSKPLNLKIIKHHLREFIKKYNKLY